MRIVAFRLALAKGRIRIAGERRRATTESDDLTGQGRPGPIADSSLTLYSELCRRTGHMAFHRVVLRPLYVPQLLHSKSQRPYAVREA
jgi:hypothetical protein